MAPGVIDEVEDEKGVAAIPAADVSPSGTARGYDKRVVYGATAGVLLAIIGFSFFGGSPGRLGGAVTLPPAAEDGPQVSDPPYAAPAVLRNPPAADSGGGALIPPPSSAVVGGADGRPYASLGTGAPTATDSAASASSASPQGTVGVDPAASQRDVDPRLAAWRAVRDNPPAISWSSTSGSAVSGLGESGAFDPRETSGGGLSSASPDSVGQDPGSERDSLAIRADVAAGPTLIVPALTRIDAALVTAVNSDLPGDVIARVTRDVLAAGGGRIAIPAGTILLGKQSDQVVLGQRRLMIAWTALQLPDLTNVQLPGLSSGDPAGAAGLAGRVDTHATRAFGRALLLSAIGAGFQLSQPQTADGSTPSASRSAAAAVGQQLAELGSELLRRDVSARPTIRLEQGTAVSVLVASELRVPARTWVRTGRTGR